MGWDSHKMLERKLKTIKKTGIDTEYLFWRVMTEPTKVSKFLEELEEYLDRLLSDEPEGDAPKLLDIDEIFPVKDGTKNAMVNLPAK
jgi:hypothetical protein